MTRKVVISSFLKQILVGIVEDGRLAEFFLERDEQSRTVGNIYKGKIENVLPGMAAAFVDLGLERNGFLYVDDLQDDSSNHAINELVKKGESILVQVTKEPEGTKGPRVVSQLSIPGRYLVLMPLDQNLGVSRQITDSEERERLKEIGTQLQPEGMGLIVRTVAAGQSYEELEKDRDELLGLWNEIYKNSLTSSAPVLLYQDHDLIYRILRDVVTADIEEIIVDQPDIYKRISRMVDKLSLQKSTRIELYQGNVALFEDLGLMKDLERATRKRVWLNSGGYLIIDQTEALVSIDVNTGKYVGSKNLSDTVLQTNKEAAKEIAKQLRLRNIGGIIIIDFIDMNNEQDKHLVLNTLQEALAKDKTKSHVLGFTSLGLVELTRKKVKKKLSNLLEIGCPHCGGSGRILSQETMAIIIAQKIYAHAKELDITQIRVECHPQVAECLVGKGKENISMLEREIDKKIIIISNDQLEIDQTKVSGER